MANFLPSPRAYYIKTIFFIIYSGMVIQNYMLTFFVKIFCPNFAATYKEKSFM